MSRIVPGTICDIDGMGPSDRRRRRRATYCFAMTARQYVFPQAGDDIESIAHREFPDADDGAQQLLSWNLHLAARRTIGILPSDIVFTEPPPAR